MKNVQTNFAWILFFLMLFVTFSSPLLAKEVRLVRPEVKQESKRDLKAQPRTTKKKTPRVAPADLKVVSITINPTNPIMNQGPVSIRLRVKNVGGYTPSKKTSVYMDIWSVNSSGQRTGKTNAHPIPHYSFNIPKLGPGQFVDIIGSYTFLVGGLHRVEGHIQTDGLSVGEEKHTNNDYRKTFLVKELLPDLVVCGKKFFKSKPHKRSYYRLKIKNIGDAPSASCNLRFRIQKKGVKNWQTGPLAPGEERIVSRSVYWASRRVSNFSVHIDSKGEVREKQELNLFKGEICTEHYCTSAAGPAEICSNVPAALQ